MRPLESVRDQRVVFFPFRLHSVYQAFYKSQYKLTTTLLIALLDTITLAYLNLILPDKHLILSLSPSFLWCI